MFRKNIIGLAALVALALSAFAASIANATETAPVWSVTKSGVLTELAAGVSEEVTEATKVTENFVLKQTELAGITIECTVVKLKTAKITGTKGGSGGGITFEGCKATAPAADVKCEVGSKGVLTTVPVSAELLGTAKEPKVKFFPTTGTQFIEVKLTEVGGEKCTGAGLYKVTGSATGNGDNGTAAKEHAIKFTSTSGSALVFGGAKAVLTGTGGVTLKSGNAFGAM